MLQQTSQKAELFARTLKRVFLGVFAVFVVACFVTALNPGTTNAATSSTVNFQARLQNASGSIAPDGDYNVEFKLYNAASSSGSSQGSCSGDASCLWTETRIGSDKVRVANGYLTVNLGSVTVFGGSINWNQQLWLTMNIGGTGSPSWDGEMSPRIQLTAVPYAFQAGAVSATSGANIGTLSFGAISGSDTITLPDASGTVCLQSSASCGFATGSGSAFLQGGNSFGAQAVLGTNDSNGLAIRTGGTNRLIVDTSGNLQLQQATTLNIVSAASGTNLTVQGGAATSGTNVGGNLILQGGAGASTGASGSVIVKANTNDSTMAFQVQAASGSNLLTVDTTNTAIVLGNDTAPSAVTVRGGAASGSNVAGSNLTFDASNGTGTGASGDLVFRTAAAASGSVTQDAASSAQHAGSVTSLTWSHTVGTQNNRLLLVAISTTDKTHTVSSVTYGGVSLTRLTQALGSSATVAEIWYLKNPASGTASVVVTLPTSQNIVAGSISYYNVDLTTPFGTPNTNNGTGTSGTVTLSSTNTGQLVIDSFSFQAAVGTWSTTQTSLWNNGSLNGGAASYKTGTAGTTTMTWTNSGAGEQWAEAAVAINPMNATSSDSLLDRLHITATGNVGINNGNPQQTLDVNGTARIRADSNSLFQLQNSAGSNLLTANTSSMRLGVDVTYALMSAPSSLVCNATCPASGGSIPTGTYKYEVTAIDGAGGESTVSNEITVTFTGGNQTANLSWTGVTGASGYKIYRTAVSGGSGTEKYLTSVVGTSYSDSGSASIITSLATPSSNSAYAPTNVSNTNLQVAIGGNGTPHGQLYVSGTASMVPIGIISSGSSGDDYDIQVQGRYAYVTNANPTNKLIIFDVSNPASPVQVSSTSIGAGDIDRTYVQGHYLYVANGTGNLLEIYDVSNPASPSLAGSIATLTSESVYVQGRYAYVGNDSATDTFEIIDISNPAAPVRVGGVSIAFGNGKGVYAQGRYAYLADYANSTFNIYDISNPASPSLSSSTTINPTGSNTPDGVYVQGRYAYLSQYDGTSKVFDISNATSPVQVGSISGLNNSNLLVPSGNYAYSVSDGDGSLRMIDISNPANPAIIGTSASGLASIGVAVQGRYVYTLSNWDGYFRIFDMGGTFTQQLEVGSAQITNLAVNANANIVGDSSITGGLQVGQSILVSGDLSTAGEALFQNKTNSTTAFQIQNTSGLSIFTVDTTNNRITLGTGTGTSATVLVLGNKTDSGDPATCTSGGVYYNSNSNSFRGCKNGSWVTLVAGVDVQIFTSGTTNWTRPAGTTVIEVIACGGGGGGGGGAAAAAGVSRSGGSGGGGGAYVQKFFYADDVAAVGSTVSVTVGGGGSGGGSGSNGNAGGDSTFGSFLTAGGGGRGIAGVANSSTNISGGGGGGLVTGASGASNAASAGGGHASAGPTWGNGNAGGDGQSGSTGEPAEYGGGAGGGTVGNGGGAGTQGGTSIFGGGGGGAGGGNNTSNTQRGGGTGGSSGSSAFGNGGGGAGNASSAGGTGASGDSTHCGSGGGGGASSTGGSGTTGFSAGAGGAPGGGGGGGGAGTSASVGGGGGGGAAGKVWVISW